MSDELSPAKVRLTDWLGPSVPDNVMVYLHAYGDSRADDDGLSGRRIAEAILELRRWAAELQAAERERCARLCETADGFRDQREHGEKLAALIRRA